MFEQNFSKTLETDGQNCFSESYLLISNSFKISKCDFFAYNTLSHVLKVTKFE